MPESKREPLEKLRIAVMLPGLGRVQRGAEAAFIELTRQFIRYPDLHVELFGTGSKVPLNVPVHQIPCISRERFEKWPSVPCFRTEYAYEELTYILSLLWKRRFNPESFDVTLSCDFPYVNWFLQWTQRNHRPALVHVTQNGDWWCHVKSAEFRYFRCDGLVCTNQEYYERNKGLHRSVLIPNGVDPTLFRPADGTPEPAGSPLPPQSANRFVVLMSSALIPSKGVPDGIRAVAQIPEAFLVVAGDGSQRAEVNELAGQLLPGRHLLLGSVPRERMPALFRQAHAFLHMSREEPSALVYLEAASTSLPSVVHDCPVVRWTLGDEAIYVDTRDLAAVARGLRQALDPAFSREVGRKARERMIASWSWDALAAKYRSFLYEVVGSEAPRAPSV